MVERLGGRNTAKRVENEDTLKEANQLSVVLANWWD